MILSKRLSTGQEKLTASLQCHFRFQPCHMSTTHCVNVNDRERIYFPYTAPRIILTQSSHTTSHTGCLSTLFFSKHVHAPPCKKLLTKQLQHSVRALKLQNNTYCEHYQMRILLQLLFFTPEMTKLL